MLISKLPQLYYIVEADLILHYKLHPIHIPQEFLALILMMTYAYRNLIYPCTCYLYVAYFSLNLNTIFSDSLSSLCSDGLIHVVQIFHHIEACLSKLVMVNFTFFKSSIFLYSKFLSISLMLLLS